MSDAKIAAQTTILYNSFAKLMREWMLSNPDIPQKDYHKVLLTAVAMLANNQIGASTEISGMPREEVMELFLGFVSDAEKVMGSVPSDRF